MTSRPGLLTRACSVLLCGTLGSGALLAQDSPAAPAQDSPKLFVREYRITGVKKLTAQEAGDAVYPFTGPERTLEDIEGARQALENIYREKGYPTVTVELPVQRGKGGIIVLKVMEHAVGQVRIKGSRYHDLERIKRSLPSLKPGTVPNIEDIKRDFLAINQWPDRRLEPQPFRTGLEPGTVDIDLNVQDKFPLHGSVELNNRYSANTTPLRLNASLSYGNLWQRGHGLGVSYVVAPERRDDAEIISGYYLMRFESLPGLTLVLQGSKQDSNITSDNIGSITVASPGHTVGLRANIVLPQATDYFQSLSLGFDYKHYDENLFTGGLRSTTALTYFPFSVSYNGTWSKKNYTTDLSVGAVLGIRGQGSDPEEFEQKRFRASSNFIYFHGELSHEREFAGGWQGLVRVQGQLADQPLVNTEQIAGGGLGTVRGYLESEVLGDNAIFGTLELRTPSLLQKLKEKGYEWRLYAFADGGYLNLREALPDQEDSFSLASVGFGSRIHLFDHLKGAIDIGWPLVTQSETESGNPRVTFRVWADF